ncbi:MAG: hypothetical protein B6245_21255 [Desulfobacteraceae bacterium 4572_88]|nr:MAG: hypothetical protein B6245_21255 [Desulfobacteraceae bacterium 4572_88]
MVKPATDEVYIGDHVSFSAGWGLPHEPEEVLTVTAVFPNGFTVEGGGRRFLIEKGDKGDKRCFAISESRQMRIF